MASIFHYTDASGLIGIISSRSLFATHYRCLNDSSEAGIIRDLVMPILESEVAALTPKLVERGLLNDRFYKEHGEAGHKLQAQSIFDAIEGTMDNVSPFFVLSFCRHDPSTSEYSHGLLSQWRGYSNGGGVAIEFDEDQIDALMRQDGDKHVYGMSKSADVLYDAFDRLFEVKHYEGVAAAMIGRLFKGHNAVDLFGQKSIEDVVRHYITTAPFLKHYGFREEREYRVVLAPVRRDRTTSEFKGKPKPIWFRARDGLVVPYIKLEWNELFTSLIKSVVVGPHPRQKMQYEAVQLLLESHGIKAEVRASEIPFISRNS